MSRLNSILIGMMCMLLIMAGNSADARNAKCLIKSSGETFHDICDFQSEAGGSFILSQSATVGYFLSFATDVSVHVYEPGLAEVRGLNRDGINSRWGRAIRSTQDSACWAGEDFEICAW